MNLEATLTKMESEVAPLLARGYQTKEVANKLFISPHTVIQHRKSIFRKAGVTSIGQMCAWFYHKTYNIPLVIETKIILAALFLTLAVFNEFDMDDKDAVRTRTSKTAKVRRGKRKDSDNDSPFKMEA